jgi:hypothetical protein
LCVLCETWCNSYSTEFHKDAQSTQRTKDLLLKIFFNKKNQANLIRMPDNNGYTGNYSRILFQKLNQIRLVTRKRKSEYNGAISETLSPPINKVGEMSCAASMDENAPYIPRYL